jgi:hypothetical protein
MTTTKPPKVESDAAFLRRMDKELTAIEKQGEREQQEARRKRPNRLIKDFIAHEPKD